MNDYSTRRSSDWLPGVLMILMQLVIWVPYLFGLGFSFYRFGSTDGIISVVVPPYAWYRGISYLWVEPKWKEDWDLKTGNLAFLVMNTASTEPQVEYELRQYESKVQKWLNRVPEQERAQLRTDADALGEAVMAYGQEFITQISQTGTFDVDFIKSPSIQRHVDKFRDQKGFMEVWGKFDTQQRYAMEMIKKEMDKRAADMDVDEFRLMMLDFMESQGSAQLKLGQEQLDMRIKKLFDE